MIHQTYIYLTHLKNSGHLDHLVPGNKKILKTKKYIWQPRNLGYGCIGVVLTRRMQGKRIQGTGRGSGHHIPASTIVLLWQWVLKRQKIHGFIQTYIQKSSWNTPICNLGCILEWDQQSQNTCTGFSHKYVQTMTCSNHAPLCDLGYIPEIKW